MTTLIKSLKVTFLIAIMALSIGSIQTANAQETNPKIKAMQIGFMTDKLDLSETESKAFWPVYDKYRVEIKKIKSDIKKLDSSALSGEEKLTKKSSLEQQKLDVQNKYQGEFKAVLPVDKVAKIDQVEREFKKFLFDEMRKAANRP